jgi:hypothetical protein
LASLSAAPVHAEVDVEVRHRHALGVEEALEQQLELERIDIGDPQRPRDHRAGARAAARPDRDPVLLGPVDEVPDDQEVPREAHLLDHRELGGGALAVAIRVERGAAARQLAEPPLEAEVDQLGDVRVEGLAVGDLVGRQEGLVELELDVAARGDRGGVLDRLGDVLERRVHLGRRLHVIAVDDVLEPLLVLEALAGLDRHQHVVRGRVGAVDVVAVIGGDQRNAELLAHPHQLAVERLLLGHRRGHQLEEEVAWREHAGVLARDLLGGGHAVLLDRLGDLAAQARRHADQPLAVIAQQLLVDPRVVIEPLEVPLGVEERQVLVADLVLRQQDQVKVAAVGPVVAVGRRDVGLAAKDQLHPGLLGLAVEVERAEHVAVIGDRDRVHPEVLDLGEQILHPDRAIEQAVLGVEVQMREPGHDECTDLSHPSDTPEPRRRLNRVHVTS